MERKEKEQEKKREFMTLLNVSCWWEGNESRVVEMMEEEEVKVIKKSCDEI